jgi:hypothetical protein
MANIKSQEAHPHEREAPHATRPSALRASSAVKSAAHCARGGLG